MRPRGGVVLDGRFRREAGYPGRYVCFEIIPQLTIHLYCSIVLILSRIGGVHCEGLLR